jgi:DNA polymerase-3 subunit gamma/tau
VKFILCTTEPHKVPATIQSRCQRFDFRNISAQRIAGHLNDVLSKEGIAADEAVVLQVARLANGSMRDGLSLLDRLVAASDGALTQEVARDVLGLPDDEALDAIVRAIAQGDAAAAITAGGALLERGFSADHALECLAARLRDVMVIGVCGPQTEMVELPSEAKQQLADVSRSMQGADLVHAIALADAASRTCRSSSIPRVVFDALLARLALAERFEATGAAPPKK